jgi:hypothetical protein
MPMRRCYYGKLPSASSPSSSDRALSDMVALEEEGGCEEVQKRRKARKRFWWWSRGRASETLCRVWEEAYAPTRRSG